MSLELSLFPHLEGDLEVVLVQDMHYPWLDQLHLPHSSLQVGR